MKRVLILIFVFIHVLATSQNMVPNGSFEDTIACPTNSGQINKARHWFAPQGGGGSSELYHTCYNDFAYPGYVSIPKNAGGFQHPRSGNAYAGCYMFKEPYYIDREFIEVQLISGLNPALTYYVEFWVSLIDEAEYGIENIGVFFSYDKVELNNQFTLDSIIQLTAQVEYSGNPIIDTMNWVKISGYYKPPKDGISYMTIGNFTPSDSTNYQYVGYNSGNAYYYIDDVLVVDSTQVGINEYEKENNAIKIFSNPAKDFVQIKLQKQVKGNITVKILELSGKVIRKVEFDIGQDIILQTMDLKDGFYLIRVDDENGNIGSGKLIIQHH